MRVAAAGHINATPPIKEKAAADGNPRTQKAARKQSGGQRRWSKARSDELAARADEIQFSDLLTTQAANSARLHTMDEIMAANRRLAEMIDRALEMGHVPNLFGWSYELIRAMWHEALGMGADEKNTRSTPGADFLLVSEASFRQIDDELSLDVLHQLERISLIPPSPPYLRELLTNTVSDLDGVCEFAQFLAELLHEDASSDRIPPTQRRALSNHRRFHADRLFNRLNPADLLNRLPEVETTIWDDDDRSDSRRLQMLYLVHLTLQHRLIITGSVPR